MTGLKVLTAPSNEPLTTAEVKTHLRNVFQSDETALLSDIIIACRERYEMETNRALVKRTLQLSLDDFPGDRGHIRLPRPPVSSVTKITYVETGGDTATWSTTNVRVDDGAEMAPARVTPVFEQTWPATRDVTQAVKLEFEAGEGSAASDINQLDRQAIKLMVGNWYLNRQETIVADGYSATVIPNTAQRIVNMRRVMEFG